MVGIQTVELVKRARETETWKQRDMSIIIHSARDTGDRIST